MVRTTRIKARYKCPGSAGVAGLAPSEVDWGFAGVALRIAGAETVRQGLAVQICQALGREGGEHEWRIVSADVAEGTRAMLERRVPMFAGE
jgi:hypothetical protein